MLSVGHGVVACRSSVKRERPRFFVGRPQTANPYRFLTASWGEWMEGYVWASVHYGAGAVLGENEGNGVGRECDTV